MHDVQANHLGFSARFVVAPHGFPHRLSQVFERIGFSEHRLTQGAGGVAPFWRLLDEEHELRQGGYTVH